jgi:hypothetical protein
MTPYEYLCKTWTADAEQFTMNPIHQMPGLNTRLVAGKVAHSFPDIGANRAAICVESMKNLTRLPFASAHPAFINRLRRKVFNSFMEHTSCFNPRPQSGETTRKREPTSRV